MILQILIFAFGLVLLVWGSNLFVDSAVTLANYLHLPEVLIGATIVSLGTTLPELLFSTMAAAKNLPEMALGNALGSILCNTGFIAGLLILLKPMHLNAAELKNIRSGGLFLGCGFLIYLLNGILFGGLPRFSGILLLLLCALYLQNAASGQKNVDNSAAPTPPNTDFSNNASEHVQSFGASDVLRLILEAAAIYLGASLLVKSGPALARSLGVPEVVISLTLVALGTSLPELVTSLVSLKKNHSSLSLGNIIGADILNFLLVGGASAAIRPLPYPETTLHLEMPFLFFLLSLLCIPSVLQKKAGRIQGSLLLSGYLLYLSFLKV